ncbi:MAG TPA: universal stress protein, partial [Gaiellaceae bacterium]|nr:universal stress protein [Gaiellaceae bacterium]
MLPPIPAGAGRGRRGCLPPANVRARTDGRRARTPATWIRASEVTQCLVCGVGRSPGAAAVVRFAAALADRLTMRLVLVHVAHVPVIPGASGVPGGQRELYVAAVAEARDLLGRVATEAGCLDAELRVEVGEPVRRLIAVAERADAAMLVVGSGGSGALSVTLHGSVPLGLCRRARCPVLVVAGLGCGHARGRGSLSGRDRR